MQNSESQFSSGPSGYHPFLALALREWPLILAILAPAFVLWAFVELADEVVEGSTSAFDSAILLAFRSAGDLADPIGPEWFEETMRDFTALGGNGVLLLITLGALIYLLLIDKKRAAMVMAIAVGGGIVVSTLLKQAFDRPRPDLVPHGAEVFTASFPSGHSMMSAVVYLTLAAMLARVRPEWRVKIFVLSAALFVTLLVGVSRIYLGVHWPTDVLAGWSVGAAWALVCWVGTLLLQRRGRVEGAG